MRGVELPFSQPKKQRTVHRRLHQMREGRDDDMRDIVLSEGRTLT
jgi:hypothetical protein